MTLRPMSKKRRAQQAERAKIRPEVFERDRWTCLLARHPLAETYGVGECFGILTVHHLKKTSQGGEYSMDNLVTLCAGHNTWVEDHPMRAEAMGLVRQ